MSKIGIFALFACLSTTGVMGRIDLTAAKLAEITGEHIHAEEYEFDGMKIFTIDVDTFSKVKKTIMVIDLSYNNLTSVPAGVFNGLDKLKKIDLGTNPLVSIDPKLFAGLKNLEEIKLKKCGLKVIADGTFAGLSTMHTLDLSMNYLTTLNKNIFSELKSLVELELRYNKLESFDLSLIAGNRKLKEISLDNNQLSRIDVNSFNKLCLERLSLEENKDSYYVKLIKKCMIVSKVSNRDSGAGSKAKGSNGAVKSQMNNVPFFFNHDYFCSILKYYFIIEILLLKDD